MENIRLQRLKDIANKPTTYNKDINQHIESCRISIDIIRDKDTNIKLLTDLLAKRDEEYKLLQEENLRLRREVFIKEIGADIKENELKEVLKEQYQVIEDQDKLISILKLNQKK